MTKQTKPYGGVMVYVNADIPSRELGRINLPTDIQIIPIELNLRKQKWVIFTLYRPPSQPLSYFMSHLTQIIDYYYKCYDRFILLGDFNVEPTDTNMAEFMDSFQLSCLINDKTCFKSKDGSCIDLILTNCKSSFMHCQTVETGISDHHLLIYGMLKTTFTKAPPKEFIYRCYKTFSLDLFLQDLYNQLLLNITDTDNYSTFQVVVENVLEAHAPCKKKVIRGNSKPHMTKQLRKEIMKRSRLKNIANKSKRPEDFAAYKRQRNLIVKLNKQQKNFSLIK